MEPPLTQKNGHSPLVGTAALVGLTGHFGGTLIHGMEHFRC
jgi:hypothetical protein